ncbi:protein of unknown function (plasmid) [Cupriavidus taiwanensis]|uniref:CBS domain-containing protein n=1 Tax=Cupriavidus taiwanensis TaxID=164546 RepID=A0A375ILR1_9BURK|nr:protein of unknown function [Cupriavidus taiwanensis]
MGPPVTQPAAQAALHVQQSLASRCIAVFPQIVHSGWSGITAGRLLRPAPTVSPAASNDAVLRTFQEQPELQAVAVVNDEGRPLAIIGRQAFIDRYAAPFHRELYGRRPASPWPAAIRPASTSVPASRTWRRSCRARTRARSRTAS